MSELLRLEDIENRIFFFVRFGEKQNLQSLVDGKLFMHCSSFHNELEEKKHIRGQGDKNDGKMVFSDVRIQMFDPETNVLLLSGTAKQAALFSSGSPIFCLFAITKDNIIAKEIDHKNNSLILRFRLTDELREYFRDNYKDADSALIMLSQNEFIQQINDYSKSNNLNVIYRMVKYSNTSVNYVERIRDCTTDMNNCFFWKDNYFSPEQEFRFLFPSLQIKDNITLPIGKISNTYILDIDKLFNIEIDLSFPFIEVEDPDDKCE